ncbi:pyridine nucleotide-disulfide oxidoreductase [Silicimonas algicola]|uniref:3-phenylpropionate/trans-cinnamate dioxygenase ferredoxin reductase subunit n=1 Tax=Silicimonas algicola TaxID=1826607 RepID=A0A316G4C3_9RHOB|nr:FAD-dependent oxidoreductase [Silicimonas algicola]AZQ68601.1 pyridine nucleotide-disulfide oxidoreductase [Silicimonas algicola]PWK55678.1 3-phenylpropionate/trans-cinnamate dioxygenase ferredoxin reductase subunit [Silicimonas algicola]
MTGILIVGGGQAGSTLAQTLRSEGYEGRVMVLGAEPVLPYERPPLSKAYLMGEVEQERLYLRPAAIYEEWKIEMRLGTPVTGIDTATQTVTAGNETLGYDELALCTGSVPNRLPAAIGGALDGVFTVRSLADIDRMKTRVSPGARVLVVGGGYIGLEAAAVASKLGLSVTVVEMSPRILSRVAAPETSDVIRAEHEAHGVRILEGCGLVRLTGEGHVNGAELTDGSVLEIDFAIVGTGIRPDTALAEAAGIFCDNGIAVDEMGRTSAPHVWAAGDCASFPYKGGRMRLESVQNAIDQAQAVARNMLGANVPYVPHPWFWSDQYDLKLQIAGLGTGYDRIVVREGEGGRSHWYFKDGRLLAVDAIDAARDYMVGKRLLEMGRTVDPEAVADASTNLKALLKG